jgi:hypothetical protein
MTYRRLSNLRELKLAVSRKTKHINEKFTICQFLTTESAADWTTYGTFFTQEF